tara:strand:- start:675 stop:827 length:153 start_codon:yes stop_codon:yes gene_type:complete
VVKVQQGMVEQPPCSLMQWIAVNLAISPSSSKESRKAKSSSTFAKKEFEK